MEVDWPLHSAVPLSLPPSFPPPLPRFGIQGGYNIATGTVGGREHLNLEGEQDTVCLSLVWVLEEKTRTVAQIYFLQNTARVSHVFP